MTAPVGHQNVITDQNQVGAVPFYLRLANYYFSSHRACNIVHHPVAGLARVALVVADFKGIRDG